MNKRLWMLAIGVTIATGVCEGQVLFYNGDWNSTQAGLPSTRNGDIEDVRSYDNFLVPSAMSVRGVWANVFLENGISVRGAYYEIRQGVREGSGGTLVASGTVSAMVTPTGRGQFGGPPEDHVRIPIGPVALAPGEYWVSVAVIANGRGGARVTLTDGLDRDPPDEPNPAPIGRLPGGSFIDSNVLGYNFAPVRRVFGYDADGTFGVGMIQDQYGGYSLAENYAIQHGDQVNGELTQLWFSDGRRLVISQRHPTDVISASAEVAAWTIGANAGTSKVELKVRSRCSGLPTSRVVERIELLNTRTNLWESMIEQPGSTSDRVTVVTSLVDSGRFVEPLTNRITARIGWYDRGVLNLGWSGEIDELVWFAK